MKSIAIIKPNILEYQNLIPNGAELMNSYGQTRQQTRDIRARIRAHIADNIRKYVSIVHMDIDTPQDEMLRLVCEGIMESFPGKKIDSDVVFTTQTSYATKNKLYEIMYVVPMYPGYQKNVAENMNCIGSLASINHTLIENNCVILCSKYPDHINDTFTLTEVALSDIVKIICRRFYFSGVVINNDGIVEKCYFQGVPYIVSRVFGLPETDHIQQLSFDILGYNFIMLFQYKCNKPINEMATRLNGLYQIRGTALLIHEMKPGIYTNIGLTELAKLNELAFCRLYDRNLRKTECKMVTNYYPGDDGQVKEKQEICYWNKYVVVGYRYRRFLETGAKCIYCSEKINDPIVCQKCFRARYCSQSCVVSFRDYHFDECLNSNSLRE